MGINIHMYLINTDGKYLIKDTLYTGRNVEWFDKLDGSNSDYYGEYNELSYCLRWGVPEFAPASYMEIYNTPGFYGFHYIKLKDFLNWVDKYKPQLTAGYVTRYEKFLYEKKGIVPLEHYPYMDKPTDRTIFMEWINEREESYVLAKYLTDFIKYYSIEERDKMYIVYCFDR